MEVWHLNVTTQDWRLLCRMHLCFLLQGFSESLLFLYLLEVHLRDQRAILGSLEGVGCGEAYVTVMKTTQ